MAYDLIIRNGTVVDGSGQPRFRADVGIVGDRIARIGRIDEKGRARSTPRDSSSPRASSTATPTWTPRSSGTTSARAPAGTG